MTKMLRVYLICFAGFALLFNNAYAKFTMYDCSSNISEVDLELNELVFFHSNKNVLTESYIFHCNIAFMANNILNKNIRGLIVYRYFDYYAYLSPIIFTFSNTIKISTNQPAGDKIWYLEGQVIFEEHDTSCPLESISRIKGYEFTSDMEVLHLTNSYNNINTMTHPCNWKFIAPNGYGFKVVITVLDIDKNTRLIIKNETDILLNEKSFKPNHPLYNSDTYIHIHLSNTQPDNHFQAYISIVKTNALIRPSPCKLYDFNDHVDHYFEWYTFNRDHSAAFYENNQECSMTMIIKPGYEYWVNFLVFALAENEADYVEYSDEIPKNSSALIYISNTNRKAFDWRLPNTINVTQYPYYSVMSPAWWFKEGTFPSYYSDKYPLKFTVKYWDVPNDVFVGVTLDYPYIYGISYSFNQTNDFYIFQNRIVYITYDFLMDKEDGFFIILIEALNTTY